MMELTPEEMEKLAKANKAQTEAHNKEFSAFNMDKATLEKMIRERSLASVLEMIQDITYEDYERMAPYIHGSRLHLGWEAIRKARLRLEELGLTDLK